MVSTQKALYKWKLINRLLMLNREVRTKYAPKINFLMRTDLIFGHVRSEFSDTLVNKNYLTDYILSDRYTTNAKAINANVIQRLLFILGYPFLFSFSRQVAMTQAEKLEFSFFARSSICSISSWGKRISLRLVIFVSLAIIMINSLTLRVRTFYTIKEHKKSIDLYGRNNIYCADRFLINPYFNDSPKYWHTKDYLTQPNPTIKRGNDYG